MSAARDALLARIIDHVAVRGLADTSLRELADEVGTSHRMLNYHFGGRAGLVTAIVSATEAAQRQALAELGRGAATPEAVIEAQWEQLTQPELAPLIRLFFELFSLALADHPGTEGFLDGITEPWLAVAADVAEELDLAVDRTELRLGVAVVRGLLIEALAAGDPADATASLRRYLELWAASRS
ncbi:MAG: TetR family transcriptional regulator [Actinomycetota bacterium]